MGQPVGEKRGEPGSADLCLRGARIVRNAVNHDRLRVSIPDRAGGSRVAVPWLTDAPHVNDVPVPGEKLLPAQVRFEAELVGTLDPDPGTVGVADKTESSRKEGEGLEAVTGRNQVVPLLRGSRAGVGQSRPIDLDDERKTGEIRPLVFVKPMGRPESRGPGERVEPVEIQESHRPVVMVSPHNRHGLLANPIEARPRVGPVPDHVSKTEESLDAARVHMGQDGGERLQVAVDVREEGVPDDPAPPSALSRQRSAVSRTATGEFLTPHFACC